eukprot:6186436-Pleurochrysis_carterae.AAC.1
MEGEKQRLSEATKRSGAGSDHGYVRETLGTVIFMWIPSHVGIVPNIIADGIPRNRQRPRKKYARPNGVGRWTNIPGSEKAGGGMISRDMHRPPEGGDR